MLSSVSTDAELIRQIRVGDRIAFRLVFDRYYDRLYRLARKKMVYAETAEEIVQDIFVDLWERREIQLIENLERYLLRAVKYKVLDDVRAQIVRKHYEDTVVRTQSEVTGSDVEEEMAFNELQSALLSAIQDLPDKTRQIFRLSRVEQLSVREISDALNIPERTVTYHIAQATRSLRIHLKDFLPLMFLIQCAVALSINNNTGWFEKFVK